MPMSRSRRVIEVRFALVQVDGARVDARQSGRLLHLLHQPVVLRLIQDGELVGRRWSAG